jgi:alpha-galactosidase
MEVDALTLAGRWNRQFQEQRLVLPIGQYRFENRYGRTSHEYLPGLIMGDLGFGQEQGLSSVFISVGAATGDG